MKVRNLLLAALFAAPAIADTPATTVDPLANEPALSAKRLSGSLTVGYETNYTGRGYVVSHSVAQGDSVLYAAAKFNYDIGKRSKLWSLGHTIAYHIPTSGHKLYGKPKLGPNHPSGAPAGTLVPFPEKNIENQFTLVTEAKYTRDNWNVAFGHSFVHGGLLGVMAKHYRHQGASVVNEVFIAPEWTPRSMPWLSAGVKTSLSFQGIQGWWFEPYITGKFPLNPSVKPATEGSVLGVVTLAMSATADYFADPYNACGNGSQAFWIKLSTPWFVKDNFILTPSVSFNWLGKGGMDANRRSHVKHLTGNPNNIPFRNFGVVFGISATYTF
ncbi:MAG: hypothetical protein IJ993_10620 [Akkermansia sp.]|nr:hypothetical protein [Akkermansia sp.]